MNGKGDKQRPTNLTRYGAGWDRVFGKDEADYLDDFDITSKLVPKRTGIITGVLKWHLAKPNKKD